MKNKNAELRPYRYKFSCSGRGLYPSLNTSDHVTIPTFGISDRIAHKGICNPPNTILGNMCQLTVKPFEFASLSFLWSLMLAGESRLTTQDFVLEVYDVRVRLQAEAFSILFLPQVFSRNDFNYKLESKRTTSSSKRSDGCCTKLTLITPQHGASTVW